MKFGIFIRGYVNSFSILAEAASAIMNLDGPSLGREQSLVSSAGIESPQIALIGGDFFECQDLLPVR